MEQTDLRRMGAPITSLSDRDAYVALGRSRRGQRGDDAETTTWALEATVAAVADDAGVDDCARILAWVREGEYDADIAAERRGAS